MISPNLMIKGNRNREAYLMRKYEEISERGYEALENSIDAKVDPQLTFDEHGNIFERAN